MTKLVFVDCETTGLDPARHEPWEIALIVRRPDQADEEWTFQPDVADMSDADPGALRISRFYERRNEDPDDTVETACTIAGLTANAHLVGAVPSFDASFLDAFLRRNGYAPAWHYHLIDVEALAVGYLRGIAAHQKGAPAPGIFSASPPWRSNELTAALRITIPEDDKHTALGDAYWARAIYDRVMGTEASA